MMFSILDEETQHVLDSLEASGGAGVSGRRDFEIRCVEVVEVMFLRDGQEVASDLTTQERDTVVVRDSRGVSKAVAPHLDEARAMIVSVERVDAHDTHFRVAGGHLSVRGLLVVETEDDGRKLLHAQVASLPYDFFTKVSEKCEPTGATVSEHRMRELL